MGQLPDDEDPWAPVTQLVRVLEPGSYVALADGTDTSETMNRAIEAYNAHAPSPYHLRGPDRIASFLDGLELVEPGVVRTVDRRPDPDPDGRAAAPSPAVSGVGRKP
ncbi:SAM-dependent methyltransferase [Streptomyces sp. NPDC048438]|uniref:SAM-dependent methyltransferase n=1 Tax=Streptomyces sp. NPDC048438 TaxID=3365551 RepID=UPI003712B2B4